MINIFASDCLVVDLLGTADGPCDLTTLGDIKGIGILQKGLKWNILTDNFLSKWTQWIKQKKAFPLTNLYNFEQGTPDNETSTSSVGIMYEIRAGKPQFTITYAKSNCFHSRVFAKKGQSKWDIILFFEKHVLVDKSLDGLSLLGFNAGMFSVGTLKFQQGTDPQTTSVMFQLIDAEGFNTRMTPIANSDIAAELNSIEGAIETIITYAEQVENGADSVVVDVVSACSGAPVTGLTGDDLWILGGDTDIPVTGVAENATVPGRYTLALADALATNDQIAPALNDGTYAVVEDIDGVMYAGKAAIEVVGVTPSA